MFKTQLFFWSGGLGEDHVASLVYGTILRRSGVSEEDQDVLCSERKVLLICRIFQGHYLSIFKGYLKLQMRIRLWINYSNTILGSMKFSL